MKRFYCIFPDLYNYNLTKDVGMIPYILSINGYKSVIATYDNDNYIYMDSQLESENLSLDIITNTQDESRDVEKYITDHKEDIDILQLYHLKYDKLLGYISTYKKNNPKGRIYLKLDANNEIIDFLVKRSGILPSIRRWIVKQLFKKIDVISIETKRNYKVLLESNLIDEDKLVYLPNGIISNNTPLDHKDKVILYVGNIEIKNKSIDMLLEALRSVKLHGWKLVLVGKVMDDITEYMDTYFNESPQMKNNIILNGYITDKEELSRIYANSSIYVCSSKRESFGISTLEAAYHGNYLISTNVGGSPDIIEQTSYGIITEHEPDSISQTIQYTIDNWDNIKKDPYTIQERVLCEYSWQHLCEKLEKYF
ncbi:MAG: glycosyltransferase [Methanosphaera sp.]|nr:glycosyltransferase [Methanosphaera sp.]